MTVLAVEAHAGFDPGCRYCTATLEELAPVMSHVVDLACSRVFLYGDQTHLGRCVVLYKQHVRELFELTDEELAGFMRDVARVAAAIAQTVPCDKVNYAAYGDKADHLHAHVVPKTQGGPAWGQPFVLNAGVPVQLTPEETQALLTSLRQRI
jgi:ATP adenylyltransferase